MAREIQISGSVSANKDGRMTIRPFGAVMDMAGSNTMDETQDVGTVAEALTLGDVGTPKLLVIVNLDQTNYVEVDSANTFDKFPQKLLPGTNGQPGDCIVLLPQTGTIYVKAHTAAVRIGKLAL